MREFHQCVSFAKMVNNGNKNCYDDDLLSDWYRTLLGIRTIYVLTHFSCCLWGRFYYYSHFTDVITDAQTAWVTCPKVHSQRAVMCVCMCAQYCLTPCDPWAEARRLEWVTIFFSGDLPDLGIEPAYLASPVLTAWFFTSSATWEAPQQVALWSQCWLNSNLLLPHTSLCMAYPLEPSQLSFLKHLPHTIVSGWVKHIAGPLPASHSRLPWHLYEVPLTVTCLLPLSPAWNLFIL